MTEGSDARPGGFGAVLIGLLVIATAVAGAASGSALAADADDWPDTCLDAPTVEAGTQSGQFDSKGDRDVFAIDLDRGDSISVNFTGGVGGDRKIFLFAVNRFVMRMDGQKERAYFDVNDDAFPKHYYDHSEDVSVTPGLQSVKTEHRADEAGKELFARHLVEAYQLSGGEHDFRMTWRTNEPLCMVVRMEEETAAGSWIFSYAVHESADLSKEDLERTLTAKNARIDELETTLNESEGQIATLESRVSALENGSGVEDTPTPRVRTVVRTPASEQSSVVDSFGLIGNVLAALVIGFVAFAGGLFLGFR